MEQRGYVERRPDPTNPCAILVCLTERGWDEMRACSCIPEDVGAELAERLGPRHLEQLQGLLVDFTAALSCLCGGIMTSPQLTTRGECD